MVGTAGEVLLYICKPHFCLVKTRTYRAIDSDHLFISLWCLWWVDSKLPFATFLHPSLPPLGPQIVQMAGWWMLCYVRKVNVCVFWSKHAWQESVTMVTLKVNISHLWLACYLNYYCFLRWKGIIASLALFETKSVIVIHLPLAISHTDAHQNGGGFTLFQTWHWKVAVFKSPQQIFLHITEYNSTTVFVFILSLFFYDIK